MLRSQNVTHKNTYRLLCETLLPSNPKRAAGLGQVQYFEWATVTSLSEAQKLAAPLA